MDNLTHSLVGALLGQAGLKKKTGLAMPALIIGANLPDVDAACFFWLEGQEHLGFRRGITHGPPALVLLPLILAGLLWGFDRWQEKRGKRPEGRRPVSFKWLFLLSFIGCLTHPALDWLNVYGIRLLEPFSSRWFYGDTLFIIDVWLWALMGFATWFSLRRERKGGDWIKPARAAIAMSLTYIGLNGVITGVAEHQGNELIVRGLGETPTLVVGSPVPLKFWEREVLFRFELERGKGGGAAFGSGEYDLVNGLVFFAKRGRAGGDERITPETVDELLDGQFPYYGYSGLAEDFARLTAEKDDEVAAFLFWSRMPIISHRVGYGDDCEYISTIMDQRFMDPRAQDRFTVVIPRDDCPSLENPYLFTPEIETKSDEPKAISE